MKHQEGKCKYKPAPENEVKVDMTIKNVDLDKMDEEAKTELRTTFKKKIAANLDLDDDAVVVTLEKGSVKVMASIDLEEKIGIMEAENEGEEIDLVKEMEAIKEVAQEDMKKDGVQQELLTAATTLESVQQAAEGEISISKPETAAVAEAATKAPEIVTEAPTFESDDSASPTPSSAPTPSGSPTPAAAPTPAGPTEPPCEVNCTSRKEVVSKAAVYDSGFVSLLIGSTLVVLLQ